MIVAHHAGEDVVLMLAAGGTCAVPVLATVLRARLSRFADRLRRR